jgi:hypothetical protein
VKDSGFGGVIGEGRAIVVKDGDRVASFPAGRLGMEISSVFVTGDSKFHFSAGFPVDPTFLNRGVMKEETSHCNYKYRLDRLCASCYAEAGCIA